MHETSYVCNKIFFEIEITSLFQGAGRRNVLREGWRFCMRIEAQMTTCLSDCRIRDTPRGGFRTSKSRQLSTMKKRGEEGNEKRQRDRGSPKGRRRSWDPTCFALVLVSPRLVGISEDFRWLLVFLLFDPLSKLPPFFSQYSIQLAGCWLNLRNDHRELRRSHFSLCQENNKCTIPNNV